MLATAKAGGGGNETGGGSSSGGGSNVYGYTGNSPPMGIAAILLTMFLVMATLFVSCEKDPNNGGDDPKPHVPTTDTVRFAINSVPHFVEQLPQINAAAAHDTVYVILNFAEMGVSGEQLNTLRDGISGNRVKDNVELNFTGFYSTTAGTKISYENDYNPMGRPPLLPNDKADPTIYWISSMTDLPKFQAAGQGAAVRGDETEPPAQVIDTVRFNITSVPDFISKTGAINSAASHDTVYVIINFAKIGLSKTQVDEFTNAIVAQKNKSNVEMNIEGLYPLEPEVEYGYVSHHTAMDKPALHANTMTNPPTTFQVTPADYPLFVADGMGHAVDTVKGDEPQQGHVGKVYYGIDGSVLSTILSADTIVWNVHLADAANLEIAIDWDRDVVLIIEPDATKPGGVKGMGNVNSRITRALHTPAVRTEGNLRADRNTVITSFSPRNSFTGNQSVCGGNAAPIKIGQLGDGNVNNTGTTNWELTHLGNSMGIVSSEGPYAGQDLVPHVQSTNPDNKIYFEPGRHFVDEADPNRSRYMPEWFVNRKTWFDFAVENNLTIVIEMKKIMFASSGLSGTNGGQWASSAFNTMGNAFPESRNFSLPNLQDVRATNSGDRSRGP